MASSPKTHSSASSLGACGSGATLERSSHGGQNQAALLMAGKSYCRASPNYCNYFKFKTALVNPFSVKLGHPCPCYDGPSASVLRTTAPSGTGAGPGGVQGAAWSSINVAALNLFYVPKIYYRD